MLAAATAKRAAARDAAARDAAEARVARAAVSNRQQRDRQKQKGGRGRERAVDDEMMKGEGTSRLKFSRPISKNRLYYMAGRIFYNFRHFERSIVSTKSAVEVPLRCPDGAPRDCEGEGGAFQVRHGRRPS